MFLLTYCFFFVLIIMKINTQQRGCVYSQIYWKNNITWPSSLLNNTICNISWIDIMNIDPLKIAIYDNINWVLYFQQVNTALLNSININNNSNITDSPIIGNSIIFILNELELYCNNISNFLNNNYQNRLSNEIEFIYFYNLGLKGPPRCQEEDDNQNYTIMEEDPFIYINSSYYINDFNNNSITINNDDYVINNVYKIQLILIISIFVLIFIVIPVLIIYIILISNPNRQYFIFNPLSNESQEEELIDKMINEEVESDSDNVKIL
jgi:hypothetical protein